MGQGRQPSAHARGAVVRRAQAQARGAQSGVGFGGKRAKVAARLTCPSMPVALGARGSLDGLLARHQGARGEPPGVRPASHVRV